MIEVRQIDKTSWARYFSENAHRAVFEETKPASKERIDFALLAVTQEDEPISYLTARELDSDTLYWQFGGAFVKFRGTPYSFKSYEAFVEWTKARYKRVVTYIENSNVKMLRMAMAVGYRITGIRNYHGDVLLEHTMEFGLEIGNA